MAYKKQRTGFHLRHLPAGLVSELLELEDRLRVHPCEDRPGEFNAAFWLEDGKDYSWLPGFLERHGLSPERYGFTVSVVTEEESGVVDLPAWVAPLVRQVEAGLRFSYTFLDPALEAEEVQPAAVDAPLPLESEEQIAEDRQRIEQRMAGFEESLAKTFGEGRFPFPLVGDLTDLLETLEEVTALLQSILDRRHEAETRALYFNLGILLDQDLPWILEDVRPALQAVLEPSQ